MPDEIPADRISQAKFSNASGAWWRETQKPEDSKPQSRDGKLDAPLAGLVEQALKGSNLDAKTESVAPLEGPSQQGPTHNALPHKLVEELSALYQAPHRQTPRHDAALLSVRDRGDSGAGTSPPSPASHRSASARLLAAASVAIRSVKLTAGGTYRTINRRLRPAVWRRNYLIALSAVHAKIFDRRIERLLFFKTPLPDRHAVGGEDDPRFFRYAGPIPVKVLEWALSALPADMKRFAFIDFRAENGRALLLASRRNFEHARGYAHDGESCEILEMNLAQYSRSYMSCRDVRALRAGRDGLEIPQQPAVLFFPHSFPTSLLESVLSDIAETLRLNPRSIYLFFENSGRERELEQMKNFRPVPLPLINRVKVALFAPAPVAVYKSKGDGSGNQPTQDRIWT